MVSFLNSEYLILLGSFTKVPSWNESFQLDFVETYVVCQIIGVMDNTAISCGSISLLSNSP